MEYDRTYFERQYRDYERYNSRRKLDFYRKLAVLAAGSKSEPRLLDIGCAFGHFLACLDSNWARFGVDVSPYAIQKARERALEAHFAVTDANTIPFEGPFDIITAFDFLEHFPRLDQLLGLVSSSLVRDGAFVFVVPVYDGPTGPLVRALDRDPTHVHKRSRDFWLRWVAQGFDMLDWWGIYRYLLPGGYYVHVVTRALRGFTPAIACLVRRR